MKARAKLGLTLAALALAAGCGDAGGGEPTSEARPAELEPVKQSLTDHSGELVEQVEVLRENADEYYALAESVDFDYDRLLAERGDEGEENLGDSKDGV